MNKFAIVLAAGKGTRMGDKDPNKSKVSHEILGIPLVNHVLNALKNIGFNRIITVVGYAGEHTSKLVEKESDIVWQREQKGTGHAVKQAGSILNNLDGCTIVLCGDAPLIKSNTINNLINEHINNNNQITVLGAVVDNPFGYGRLLIDQNNELVKIVEQKNATEEEQKINLVNTGVIVFDNKLLFENLNKLEPNPKTKEYYLTDLIELFKKQNYRVGYHKIYGREEMMGVNDPIQLQEATSIMRHNINQKLIDSGVIIEDIDSTNIAPTVYIEPGVIIKKNTTIYGNSSISKGNIIGPDTKLVDVKI